MHALLLPLAPGPCNLLPQRVRSRFAIQALTWHWMGGLDGVGSSFSSNLLRPPFSICSDTSLCSALLCLCSALVLVSPDKTLEPRTSFPPSIEPPPVRAPSALAAPYNHRETSSVSFLVPPPSLHIRLFGSLLFFTCPFFFLVSFYSGGPVRA